MKVLLIQPPIQDFYQTSIRTQPIGLAYLAASLKTKGHEVEILDCQTKRKKSISIPPELSYLRDLYPFNDRSPFKLYTGYYHFGMGWEEIKKRIQDSKADVFGICKRGFRIQRLMFLGFALLLRLIMEKH